MWKPASFVGLPAPRAGRTVLVEAPSSRPRTAFPQRGPGLSAILSRMCCLEGLRSGNRVFQKAGQNARFYRFSLRAGKRMRDPLYLFARHLAWRREGKLGAYQDLLAGLDDSRSDVRLLAESLLHRPGPRPDPNIKTRNTESARESRIGRVL